MDQLRGGFYDRELSDFYDDCGYEKERWARVKLMQDTVWIKIRHYGKSWAYKPDLQYNWTTRERRADGKEIERAHAGLRPAAVYTLLTP